MNRGQPPGIPFAKQNWVRTDDERLEHLCRMGLLVVAVLHWIIFILLVTSADRPISHQAPRALSNLARQLQ